MNKSALKTFATNARRELLKKVEAKAMKIGITEDIIKKADIESSDAIFIDGKQLSKEEKIQRDRLIDRINLIGFKRVMEEVAYTWFNRFTAIRFMEVNDYLPTKVRVLSSTNADSAEPDMMKEALSLELDLDKEYIYELKMSNNSEELFKYLIIKHCNDLNRYLPFMFETIDDYKEILFPEGLLATDSFLRQMTNIEIIPEGSWKKIEVIGWLYQYYIAEEKDRVFKEKKKYKAEEIPFATQLFTPDWIVQYMVQNSLGRYWIEAHPEHRELLNDWEFYLEHNQEDFKNKIAPYVNKDLNVEDLKCLDPAMGSGHILVYMFDVLYEIYSKCGYMEREIPRLIIENNLYGLDIDDRAYQLACFSLVMKALEYNHRFLRSIERDGLSLNLASIQETNCWNDDIIEYLVGEASGEKYDVTKLFVNQYVNAKTFGSLIKVTDIDMVYMENRLNEIKATPVDDIFQIEKQERVLELIPKLIKQTKIMSQQYDVVILNPPYMGSVSMNKELSNFLRINYPDSKTDLFSAFMEIDQYLKPNSYYSAINQHSWMFLSSFEKLRKAILRNKTIDTMIHLGPRAFEEIGGEVVQSTTFVLRNTNIPGFSGSYVRLVDEKNAKEKRDKLIKTVKESITRLNYSFPQSNFSKIPGSPIAYWISDDLTKTFSYKRLSDFAEPKSGLSTTDNLRFLRLWHEVNIKKVGFNVGNVDETINNEMKWFPYNKGGSFRKWYGNRFYLVNWYKNGSEIKEAAKGASGGRIVNPEYYFKESITWSSLSSGELSVRYSEKGFIFDSKGSSCFSDKYLKYILGLLNSKVAMVYLKILSPTLDFNPGSVAKIPTILSSDKVAEIENIVDENISISKWDWDNYENSWDFAKHPFLKNKGAINIEDSFKQWEVLNVKQFEKLKTNEESLNHLFIDIYDLKHELNAEIHDNDVSIRKPTLEESVKSFISYVIGCSFGRYSLDEEGVIYAGGEFNSSRYKTFSIDEDNILPILPGAYFEDDIVSRFVDFVRVSFGDDKLNENLTFVADALGRKKDETAKESLRRYFLNDFYKDHVRAYSKRPIYWLFTSGKEKAFNCLIYMHRYDKTTLSRIRTDYLHDYQIRLDAVKKDLLNIIDGDSTSKEISNAKKELKSLQKKIDELKAYDELLHHMADMQIEIDLDDGVNANYEKFKGLIAKI